MFVLHIRTVHASKHQVLEVEVVQGVKGLIGENHMLDFHPKALLDKV